MIQLFGSNSALFQGLAITVIGMGLVFAALALIWVLIIVLGRVFPSERGVVDARAAALQKAVEDGEGESLTKKLMAERAQVAAVVAAALTAGALPRLLGAQADTSLSPRAIDGGPVAPEAGTFEHGRTAPSWVTANRARALQPWQPTRRPES